MGPSTPTGYLQRLLGIGLPVAAAYVIAARVGFHLAFVAEQVTTVWAPTGIAIAALLLWGRALWPAVWVGALVVNLLTSAPWWAAAAIASGNTLEAVAATALLRRLAGFDPALYRVSDVISFIVIAATASTAACATIGVAALCMSGVQPWMRFSALWFDWWLGDALGALVVAPAILTMARATPRWSSRRVSETAAFVAGSAILTQVIFGKTFGSLVGAHPLEYVIFSFVMLVGVQLRQPATALAVLAVSGVSILNTVRGAGPFAGTPVHHSLVLLQVFMGVLAGTGLLLAAAIAEQATSERRQAAAYAVGDILSRAQTLAQAAPAMLRAICETLEWQVGALWLVDPAAGRLRCLTVWTVDDGRMSTFAEVTRQMLFAPGVGLPGRVWASGSATWIEDVARDPDFLRAPVPRGAGLHGAFAFPIRLEDEVLGVFELFTDAVVAPDGDLLRTMSTVGGQVGQFIGRVRGEAAILAGQRRTAAIMNSALDAIIGIDHHGIITEFNPAAERAFGFTRADAIGREMASLLIPARLRDGHRHKLARHQTIGELDRRVETTACHADGHEFPVEVSITRVTGEEPPLFTGVVRDVTARAEADRERELLLKSESDARREAESANRAKDDFLATLSHELRTPLNAIVGWTRILLEGTMDDRSTRRGLEVIDRNAHLQAQLVSDILDVSKIITGGLRLDVQPVDLGSVIGTALDSVRPAADAKNIRIRTHLAAAARLTEGDPHRLQQVVWNLLANAVKFTPPGGAVDVDLLEEGNDALRIRVADDGPGIAGDLLPHVFERFRQGDSSVSRQHGGLGLGLAIVRHLVELHGGTVTAESPGIGQGAIFTVELPRVPSEAVLPEPSRPAPGSPQPVEVKVLAGRRVLVVDDVQDAREMVAIILSGEGAVVETAASVDEALHRLDASWPDVLLADIGMPGADGYTLIREIRARYGHVRPYLRAAAVSAYAGPRDRERVLAAGFDEHVPKPLEPASIVRVVLSLCSSQDRAVPRGIVQDGRTGAV